MRLLWLCGALLAAASLVFLAFWAAEWYAIQRLLKLGAVIEHVDGCTACSDWQTAEQLVPLRHASSSDARGLLCYRESSGDEVLSYAKRVSGLREMFMSHSDISSEGFALLSQLDEISFLDLTRTALSDAEMGHLAKMRGLECLDIGSTEVSGDGILRLKDADNLKCILATYCPIEDLELVDGFRSLQHIDVRDCPIVGAKIQSCSSLRRIQIDSPSLRSVRIADSPALEAIDLCPLPPQETLQVRIENLPGLKSLILKTDNMSETVVRGVPALESLRIESDSPFSELLRRIADESQLKEVTLYCFTEEIQKEAVSALVSSRSRDSIMKVSLYGDWKSRVIGLFADLPEVRHLDVSGNDLVDDDLRLIERFPRIEVLDLSWNLKLTAAVSEMLLRSKSLRTVIANSHPLLPDWLETAKQRTGQRIQFIVKSQ